jgi:hypothetical protein
MEVLVGLQEILVLEGEAVLALLVLLDKLLLVSEDLVVTVRQLQLQDHQLHMLVVVVEVLDSLLLHQAQVELVDLVEVELVKDLLLDLLPSLLLDQLTLVVEVEELGKMEDLPLVVKEL